MTIYSNKEGTTSVLYIVPNDDEEAEPFKDFARVNEPLTAVVKHGLGFRNPHLEIRKEIL